MYKNIDKDNMYNSIWDFPDNLIDATGIGDNIILKNSYDNIEKVIVAGMGGSAIGGDVVAILGKEKLKTPFFVIRDYTLPPWIDDKTLIICSSYSGNTEETLSVLNCAIEKGIKVFGLTTGGELADLFKRYEQDMVIIPSGLQPRASIAYSIIPIIRFLSMLNIFKSKNDQWITETVDILKEKRSIYGSENETNPVFSLANKIYKYLPVIYSNNSTMAVAAKRLEGQFCENSKMLSYSSDLPELNHNEIVGWENNPHILNNICVLWILDSDDNDRIKHRIKITKEILEKIGIVQYELAINGNSFQERFLHMVNYGDWLSFWCAILHKTDPSPVKKIDHLKHKLLQIN